MAYTAQEIFEMAITIIDELSSTGAISDAYTKEYKFRAPRLLDAWQKTEPDLNNTIEFSRKPIKNLLGTRLSVEEHIDNDKNYETSETAKAFFFKVNDQADIYIEQYVSGSWVNASGYYSQDDGEETEFVGLIPISELTNPTQVKGRLTSDGEKTRIRFSGDYYYLFYNFALYKAAFPSCGKVPDYGEYVKIDMPSNFDSITQIITEYPKAGLYHKWENNNELYVNYDFDGVLKITYRPNPTKITSLSQTLELSESSCISGAYYLARHFAVSDMNTELAAECDREYQRVRNANKIHRPLQATKIRDVYRW